MRFRRTILSVMVALALVPAIAGAWDTRTNPQPSWDCGTYTISIQYDALERGEYQDQDAGSFVLAFLASGIGVLNWAEDDLTIDGSVASYRFDVIDPDDYFEYTIFLAYDRDTIAGADVVGDLMFRDRKAVAAALAGTLDMGTPPRFMMDGDGYACDRLPDKDA